MNDENRKMNFRDAEQELNSQITGINYRERFYSEESDQLCDSETLIKHFERLVNLPDQTGLPEYQGVLITRKVGLAILRALDARKLVVRCQDCEYGKVYSNGCNAYCKHWRTVVQAYGFCSEGKTREI